MRMLGNEQFATLTQAIRMKKNALPHGQRGSGRPVVAGPAARRK